MAEQKISDLSPIAGADVVGTDYFEIVDATGPTNNRILVSELVLIPTLTDAFQGKDAQLTSLAGLASVAALTDIAGITPTTGDIIYYDGANWVDLAVGSEADVLTVASGVPSWAAAGGGGSPGGADTQIQFNDGGSFGGDAALVWDKTTNALTLAQGTITDPATALSITSTWNDAADTFNAFVVNVTNTNSAAASKLIDLQIGGTSRLHLLRGGQFVLPTDGAYGTPDIKIGSTGAGLSAAYAGGFTWRNGSGIAVGGNNQTGYGLVLMHNASSVFGWSSDPGPTAPDLTLHRDAANILAQRNSTTAQTHRIYNTWTDASNGEWLEFGFSSNVPYVKANKNGTGTNRALSLETSDSKITIDGPNNIIDLVAKISSTVTSIRFAANGFYPLTGNLVDLGFAGGGFSWKSLQLVGQIGWDNAGTIDLKLVRDAANTLAQRNGTTAQAHRIYNTWTDASNGEWLEFGFATNVPYIKSAKNGTGTNRNLVLDAATGVITFPTGSAGSPSIAFTAAPTDGIWNWAGNAVIFSVGGNQRGRCGSGGSAVKGFEVGSDGGYGWNSATNFGGGPDTIIARAAAGVAKFTTDGTVGGGYATPAVAKTIATGAITITGSYCVVDTEAAAASDDLDTITGGQNGQWLVLSAANSSRDVVVKDGTGNIQCAGDCTLDNIQDTITLIYNSTQSAWLELCRSNNGA